MKRPTWVTVVCVLGIIFGVFGLLNAAQTALLPQTLKWQRELMHAMSSSFAAQDKTANPEELTKMFDSLFGPVPGWFTPWSIAAGLTGFGISIAYLYGMIALLSMKRKAVRMIYVCTAAAMALAVARGVVAMTALKFIGFNVMTASAFSFSLHCVLLLVIYSNAKIAFPDVGSATP